jgi:hypothetical protein
MSVLPITACEWRVGPAGFDELRIVERPQIDGSLLYAVAWRGRVANREREWEFEPIPSSRDEDFICRCRFAEWYQAARVAQHMAREIKRDGRVTA